jgi:hypothetical protein
VDVKRAADLYAQGWTLRQIAAELGLPETTVSDRLRGSGGTLRRSGPPAHSASTDQIVELHDQGLTWSQVAKQFDMTISGVWGRYRRARPPKPPWSSWQARAWGHDALQHASAAGMLRTLWSDRYDSSSSGRTFVCGHFFSALN